MNTPFERIEFHGLPALRLTGRDGATAIVTDYGAHVTSWQPARGGERLYLSDRSPYGNGRPIRGGVPVIFPQFGPEGPLPRHGFGRIMPWTQVETHDGGDFVRATWRLTDTPETHRVWPFGFAAELTVLLEGDRLDVELSVENTGTGTFDFTAALHTYCRVPDVELASLEGLCDARYRDQTDHHRRRDDRDEVLRVSGEVDRIYEKPPLTQRLVTGAGALTITRDGFPDVVVWNPWEQRCATLADMPPDGFRRMLCVEAAAVVEPVSLAAGMEWSGRQSLDAG